MTTLVTITNHASSNGDVHVKTSIVSAAGEYPDHQIVLTPGQSLDRWISTSHRLAIHETWPTEKPCGSAVIKGGHADQIIAAEVATQDKMWGDANERADATKGQMLAAATAQLSAINFVTQHPQALDRADAFEKARCEHYPSDWTGFRDYGSDIANLVVAATYIRNEIKRRLLKGESFERSKRQQPYTGDQPAVSSAETGA